MPSERHTGMPRDTEKGVLHIWTPLGASDEAYYVSAHERMKRLQLLY